MANELMYVTMVYTNPDGMSNASICEATPANMAGCYNVQDMHHGIKGTRPVPIGDKDIFDTYEEAMKSELWKKHPKGLFKDELNLREYTALSYFLKWAENSDKFQDAFVGEESEAALANKKKAWDDIFTFLPEMANEIIDTVSKYGDITNLKVSSIENNGDSMKYIAFGDNNNVMHEINCVHTVVDEDELEEEYRKNTCQRPLLRDFEYLRKNRQNAISRSMNDVDLWKKVCTHKEEDGTSALYPNPDGSRTCKICHENFFMLDTIRLGED